MTPRLLRIHQIIKAIEYTKGTYGTIKIHITFFWRRVSNKNIIKHVYLEKEKNIVLNI